jgi:branched-chain amino acid transport system ATP-binding protein
MSLLSITNLSKRYGGVVAINNISLSVEEGLINALIGPNGAGKTTLFNVISCIERPNNGDIELRNQKITNYRPYQVAKLGIARTFQNLCIFGNMTVLQNVMSGMHLHTKSNFFSAGLKLPWLVRQEKETVSRAKEILGFIGLQEKCDFKADELPYGEQRLLEIARALATRPVLLLLDEPAAGLNSKETDILANKINEIKETGVTIFLVEHDMHLVMMISDRVTVLNFGEIITTGTTFEIRRNSEVIRSYLGRKLS